MAGRFHIPLLSNTYGVFAVRPPTLCGSILAMILQKELMALAIHFQQMLRDGDVEDMSTLARYGQVTCARMTQIMNLLLLAPDIQEKLLNLPQTTSGRDTVILRELQTVALQPDWTAQQQMWYELYGDFSQK